MMSLRVAAVFIVACFAPAAAGAEPPEAPSASRPRFQTLRFEEDWSVLGDGVEPPSFLDPVKYVAFDEDGDFWLSLGGQVRGRLELWDDFQFGGSLPEDSDVFFLSRILLHADLHLTRYFRVFAEFKSALSTPRDLAGGKRAIDSDVAALQNGFAEVRIPVGSAELSARGGRQELLFGVQRLVSPLDWANARRTFDGALVSGEGEAWKVSGFWSRPVKVEEHEFNESDSSLQLYGVYSELALPLEGLNLDLYWLGLQFDGPRTANRLPGQGVRHTLGGRIYGKPFGTPLVLDIEGAAQIGNVGNADIQAGAFASKATWPFDVALAPALYGGYDWASGDSGGPGKVGTFDQLFPLGHAFFGFIDAIGRQNIHAVHGGAKLSPLKKSVLAMSWHAFWLDTRRDALYAASGAATRLAPGASSKHVGVEMDLTFKYAFLPGTVALVGYSHFFTGDFISQSGPDDDTDFGYLQLQYTF